METLILNINRDKVMKTTQAKMMAMLALLQVHLVKRIRFNSLEYNRIMYCSDMHVSCELYCLIVFCIYEVVLVTCFEFMSLLFSMYIYFYFYI